mgnify:CR=1 FL=1
MSNTKTFKKFEKQLEEQKKRHAKEDALEVIYNKQCALMKRYGHEPTWLKEPFKEALVKNPDNEAFTNTFETTDGEMRTKLLLDMVHALGSEVSEFRDELPWKHWKNYKEEDKWYNNEDTKTAAGFELIDILTFLMESFILLGYDAEDIKALYLTKWLENNHRQDVGYNKDYEEHGDDKSWSLGHS